MHTLGLRVGEVSRLELQDVDLDRSVLSVRQTKFAKDRLVPFGPRLGAKLTEYLSELEHQADRCQPDHALFSFRAGRDAARRLSVRGLLLGLTPAEIREHRADIAAFTELGDYLALPVHTYSSGMMLRLAFAVSTAMEPEILLMDEWIGVGDAASEPSGRLTTCCKSTGTRRSADNRRLLRRPERTRSRDGSERTMSERDKTAILVAGMHRSGTSAVSRVLSLVGCELPNTLMSPALNDNETGFWESQKIANLNEEILASAGSTWSDWQAFNPGWYDSPVAAEFHDRALALLHEEFDRSRLFVLKDPRICRMLPFWIQAIEGFGARPCIVSPIRNPLDVAASQGLGGDLIARLHAVHE